MDHRPSWLPAGASLAASVAEILGGKAVAVEHIGSTSVPGLPAKPILDLAIGLSIHAHMNSVIELLTAAGWIFRGNTGFAGWLFVQESAPSVRVAHAHAVVYGGREWDRYLAFRDTLRARPDLVLRYAEVKRALAASYPADSKAYMEGKTAVVEEVLGDLGV